MRQFFKIVFSRNYFPPLLTVTIFLISALSISVLLSNNALIIERDNVIVRTEPATNSQALLQLESNTEVNILTNRNGWYKVRVDGRTEGWIPQWLLESTSLESDQNMAAQILINTPIYSSQDETTEQIITVETGTYLFVQNEANGWVLVSFENQYGYIPTRLVNLVPAESVIDEEDALDVVETQPVYNRDELEKQRAQAEKAVVIRSNEEPLLTEAAVDSEIIYYALYNQMFTLIETIEDANGNEFYLVEDDDGIRGYLDSIRVSVSSYSLGHVEWPIANSLAQATIMLDPGHGGEDSGATNANSTAYEKSATFDTAMALKAQLEAEGATVMLTRPIDVFVDLEERAEASNLNQVDAFISLHYDGSEDPTWSGTTTYYYHEADESLAQAINQSITPLPLENVGVMFGNYHVLRENTRPSILLELGYMSNQNDLQYIFSENYHELVASAITDGLLNYFEQVQALR